MDKRKVAIAIIILLVVISGLVVGGYYVYKNFISNDSNGIEGKVTGEGRVININEEDKEFTVGDIKITLKDGGYFEGNDEFLLGNELYTMYKDHIVINTEMVNVSEGTGSGEDQEEVMLDKIDLVNASDELVGEGLFVYADETLPYGLSDEVIRENRLLVSGEPMFNKESRVGLLYIAVEELKGNQVYIYVGSNGEDKRVKLNITEDTLKDKSKWEELDVLKEGVKENLEIRGQEGYKITNFETSKINDSKGNSITYKDVKYFKDIDHDELLEFSHLNNVNGTESILLIGVEVELGEEEKLGKFKITDEAGNELENIKIVSAEASGEGVLDEGIVNDYGLLNYEEELKGNILFIGSDLNREGLYYITYGDSDISNVEERVIIIIE